MTSNGFAPVTSPSNESSTASLTATPAQPSLPPFVSTRHARSADRPVGARGRLQSWDHLPTDEVIKRGAKAAAEADASCGVGLLGSLTLTAFVALAIGMAAVAIHQEERLAPHERQLLQQQR